MRYLIAAIVSLAFVPAAAQTFATGESYYEHCAKPKDEASNLMCIAYLRGMNDALRRWEAETCNPKPFTQADRQRLLLVFLAKNPGLGGLPTVELMQLVLLQAFGCLVDMPAGSRP